MLPRPKSSEASRIFRQSKVEQEDLQKKKDNDAKRSTKNTIRAVKYTIKSLPKQIAKSRLNNPNKQWIIFNIMYTCWGNLGFQKIIDKQKFVELMKERGFEVRIKAHVNHIYGELRDIEYTRDVNVYPNTKSPVIDL